MKKKLIIMLSVCLCILGLAACGTDPKTVDYNGKTYDELEQVANNLWESVLSQDMNQLEMTIQKIDDMSQAERTALMESNEGLEEQYLLMKNWLNISKEVGSYIGVNHFSITQTGKTTTTDLVLDFEKRQVIFSIVYQNRDMSMETTTVDLVYSVGEKMQKALMNTVMGMGTVFVMLIIISLLISCFAVIPKIEKKMKAKKEKTAEQIFADLETEPVQAEGIKADTENLELIAVIAAAIAMDTGQSVDDFIVRSIKRR